MKYFDDTKCIEKDCEEKATCRIPVKGKFWWLCIKHFQALTKKGKMS